MFHNKGRVIFEVICSCDPSHVDQWQWMYCAVGDPVVVPGDAGKTVVALHAFEYSDDHKWGSTVPLVFKVPGTMFSVGRSPLYQLIGEEIGDWTESTKCVLGTEALPVVFQKVHSQVKKLLGVRGTWGKATRVFKAEKNCDLEIGFWYYFKYFSSLYDYSLWCFKTFAIGVWQR